MRYVRQLFVDPMTDDPCRILYTTGDFYAELVIPAWNCGNLNPQTVIANCFSLHPVAFPPLAAPARPARKLNGLTGLAESGSPAGLRKPHQIEVLSHFSLKARLCYRQRRGHFEEDAPGDPLARRVPPGFQAEVQAFPA
jgi:hypothetical protein